LTRAVALAVRWVGGRPRLAAPLLRWPHLFPPHLRSNLYRRLSWPLAKRFGTEVEVVVAGGNRMRVDTTDAVGRVLAISGVWEPSVTAAFKDSLAPGDVCVDAGAHIGYFTLLASKLTGPKVTSTRSNRRRGTTRSWRRTLPSTRSAT
jgi:hypothetical protein